jgi:dienelactone hydrolase
MKVCLRVLLILTAAVAASPSFAQDNSEKLTFAQDHRGKAITVGGDLFLPSGTAKVPALVIHHGSGGVSADRELRYAREIVTMGVATLVIDSFKPRGITSTVQDQSAVTSLEMLGDAFGALKALAAHPRVDGKRVGIIGFSKGGEVALQSALGVRVSRYSPDGLRFALHVPFYPWCGTQHYKPKTTGAPIYMLLGGADTYVGVEPCKEYAGVLKAEGARAEVVIYPGAKHGFDGGQEYTVAQGQNSSRCVYQQQPDGTWKERTSGIITTDSKGQRLEGPTRQAVEKCRTLGVSGGPNADARAKSMAALKSYVQQHLLDGK